MPFERERYFAALAAHVGAGGALVLSLRADHLGDLAPYPDIARVLEDGLYLLGPMGEADLRSAVEGPARRAGLRLEPGLVDLLVREVEGEPAALPLLSHVLRETWERREGPTLTVAGYLATGGIKHAVAKSAESLYDAMDDAQRSRLRSLLMRLVMPSEGGDPVRARVPRAKVVLDEAHVRLVEQLVDARLVSIDGDTVQIAHEALFRVWPRLRGWLDDDVDGQRLFRHLAGAADAWDAMDRPESELYRGTRLTRTLEWRDRARPDLSDTETAFLEASAALSESEQRAAQERVRRERRVNHRLRGALTGVAVLAVLAVVAGVLAVRSSDRAEGDRDRARSAADLADARRAGAVALEHEDLSTSLLLALSALQVDTSARAWDNLTAVLMRSPSLLSLRGPSAFFVDLTASPDGALLAVSRPDEGDGSAPDGRRHLRTPAVRGRHPRQRHRLLPGQQPLGDGGEPLDRERRQPAPHRRPAGPVVRHAGRHPRRPTARRVPRRRARSSTPSTSAPTDGAWSRPWTSWTRSQGTLRRPSRRCGTSPTRRGPCSGSSFRSTRS